MLNKTEFTEEQLIEAFRICSYESTKKNPCRNCPANESDICTAEKGHYIERRIYQLILKQKAEITELQKQVDKLKSENTELYKEHTTLIAGSIIEKQDIIKATADKIFRQVLKLYQSLSKAERETMTFEWKLLDLAVGYGVEVENKTNIKS